VPAGAETADNPRQPVGTRQPLELPADKVDQASETRGSFGLREETPSPGVADLPPVPNAGITFRILEELNQIQSRVIDRQTQEVLRSVPPDELVEFFTRFRSSGALLDLEA
jgi:hypothetical protein